MSTTKFVIMEQKEETRLDIDQLKLDADNKLIISAELNSPKPEKPVIEDDNSGYNSADNTGNTNEDLELDPNDDPETDLDEYDLEILNGQDMDEDFGDYD